MLDRHYPSPRDTDVQSLAAREGPVLSLLLPVTAVIPDRSQNHVRHARVVSDGLARWRELGGAEDEIRRAGDELTRFAAESRSPVAGVRTRAAFWSADQELSVFGLPFEFAEAAQVANCARLRPIVMAARRPARFRVLALSTKHSVLYEGTEDGLKRVTRSGIPQTLEEALGAELTDSSLQSHSAGGAGSPVYHGQGGAPRARELDLERFHRRIARALEEEIGEDVVPLVLASDVSHRPGLEGSLSRDVGLIPRQLEGNVDHISDAALHAATWKLVTEGSGSEDPGLRRSAAPVRKLSELVSSAVMGRIRSLRVPQFGSVPGQFDRTKGQASEAWGDDDLIEHLVVEALRRGGSVEVLEGESFSAGATGLEATLR